MSTDLWWPLALPRFAESFRICIDHPKYLDTRLLTGDWEYATLWMRGRSDFLPQLHKAGRLMFIASTVPVGYHHGRNALREYYGDPEYPALYWHWRDTGWDGPTDELCQRWIDRRNASLRLYKPITLELMKTPTHF